MSDRCVHLRVLPAMRCMAKKAKPEDLPGACETCPHRAAGAIRKPVRGLGDVVARAASSAGIKPCSGCERRRKWLNDRFPL
jgi:hypothetical protein